MGASMAVLLEKKIQLLQQSTDYRLLLETAATICATTKADLPEDVLASVCDAILRTVARDIQSLVPNSKVMLHIYVSGL